MARSAYDAPVLLLERHRPVPCTGQDGDLWFASHPTAVERAKALCRECPLRQSCFDDAIERHEPWGVWGGELFENGVVVTHKRPRGRPRKDSRVA